MKETAKELEHKKLQEKKLLEKKIEAEYQEIDNNLNALKIQFDLLYPNYEHDSPYEIETIDFYLADVGLCYHYDDIFKLCDELEEKNVFEIKEKELSKIYIALTGLCNEVCNTNYKFTDDDNLCTNDILVKIKNAISIIADDCQDCPSLIENLQKLYVCLDFALYETSVQHDTLRNMRKQTLQSVDDSYDRIDRLRVQLESIDREIEMLSVTPTKNSNDGYFPSNDSTYSQFAEENTNHSKPSSQRPNVLLSIIFSLFGIVVFYIGATLSLVLALLVVYVISLIPLLSFLTNIFLSNSNSFLIDIVYGLCSYFAYYAVLFVFEKIIKKEQTKKLSSMITGIILVVINALFLIINLIFGDAILANIIFGVAGFILFYNGKD